ncbi:MAG: hypothetical protein KF730_09090 [Sphingomonas sp.]|uniref:hypothetical protein n=1 Tax=Sphingomonas sp. TaxID=28214 RepID=UPI0025EF7D06|nr:hypothetical protein [Sphingomonas sp.]MBX3564716.1 hypothetical protein [Sphingomonas sp.]
MKHLIAASLALVLTAGIASAQPEPAPGKCDVKISFGSYAMGIDRGTYARVRRILAHDRGVARSSEQRWGREGEVTVCVTTKRHTDTTRLYARIRAVLPRNPRGPVTLEAGARNFTAGRAPRN